MLTEVLKTILNSHHEAMGELLKKSEGLSSRQSMKYLLRGIAEHHLNDMASTKAYITHDWSFTKPKRSVFGLYQII